MRLGTCGYSSDHHTGPFHGWHPANWTVWAGSGACSICVYSRGARQSLSILGPTVPVKCLGMQVLEKCRHISCKLKHRLSNFGSPTMKTKAECLATVIRFGKQHVPYLGISLQLTYWCCGWSQALNRKSSARGPAAWAMWHCDLADICGRKDTIVNLTASHSRSSHSRNKAMASASENSIPFKNQVLACYWSWLGRSTWTMKSQGTMHPESPVMSWGQSQNHSVLCFSRPSSNPEQCEWSMQSVKW